MKIQSTEEVMKTSYEFAAEIIAKQLQIKEINAEIKELKADYKEQGIAVGVVNRVINKLKAKAKKDPGDQLEEEIITEKFEANQNVMDQIALLAE